MPEPHEERNWKPRTSVLSYRAEKSRKHPYSFDQDLVTVAKNTRADDRIGSGPACSVLGRFILAARLRSGGRAKRRLLSVWRGVRAARARNALFIKSYMLSYLLLPVITIYIIYNFIHYIHRRCLVTPQRDKQMMSQEDTLIQIFQLFF